MLPNTGMDGDAVTAIVGVALSTKTLMAVVVGSAAKFPSP
ncbi:MAG: LPXTG cell wall anchor domain-containing protein [Mariniphaga sp.]